MTHPQRRCRFAVLCLPVVATLSGLALSGCGGSGGTGATRAASGGSAAHSKPPGGPNPNATESAPPGDIPDDQAFVAYTPPGAGYTVRVPEGWAMTHTGRRTLFTDKYNSIRIDEFAAASAPTAASATATELPAIRAAAHGFVPGAVTAVSRHAGTVVKITYRADSPANKVTGKVILQDVERYEYWRHGTEVVLTLSASLGSDNVDPWRTVTDSFGWTA